VNLNRIRLALSLGGMVVAVIAIMLEDRRVVWGAIGLLAVSLLLRVVGRRGGPGGGPRE
jgi:hypothetical protein